MRGEGVVPLANYHKREKHTCSTVQAWSVVLASHLTHTVCTSKPYLRGLRSERCMSSINGPKIDESVFYPFLANLRSFDYMVMRVSREIRRRRRSPSRPSA